MCHNAVLILCFRKSLFLLMLHDGILVLFLPFDFHSCGLSWFSFQELLLGFSFFIIIIFLFLPSGLLLDIFYWKGNAIWVVKSIDNLGITVSCCFYHFHSLRYWIITLTIHLYTIISWNLLWQTSPLFWNGLPGYYV